MKFANPTAKCYLYWSIILLYLSGQSIKRAGMGIFLGLVLIGEVLFSLLWEAKIRYVFPYIVIALPAAAMGYWYLCNCIGKYSNRTPLNKCLCCPECNHCHIDTWIAQEESQAGITQMARPMDFHCGNRCSYSFLRRNKVKQKKQ